MEKLVEDIKGMEILEEFQASPSQSQTTSVQNSGGGMNEEMEIEDMGGLDDGASSPVLEKMDEQLEDGLQSPQSHGQLLSQDESKPLSPTNPDPTNESPDFAERSSNQYELNINPPSQGTTPHEESEGPPLSKSNQLRISSDFIGTKRPVRNRLITLKLNQQHPDQALKASHHEPSTPSNFNEYYLAGGKQLSQVIEEEKSNYIESTLKMEDSGTGKSHKHKGHDDLGYGYNKEVQQMTNTKIDNPTILPLPVQQDTIQTFKPNRHSRSGQIQQIKPPLSKHHIKQASFGPDSPRLDTELDRQRYAQTIQNSDSAKHQGVLQKYTQFSKLQIDVDSGDVPSMRPNSHKKFQVRRLPSLTPKSVNQSSQLSQVFGQGSGSVGGGTPNESIRSKHRTKGSFSKLIQSGFKRGVSINSDSQRNKSEQSEEEKYEIGDKKHTLAQIIRAQQDNTESMKKTRSHKKNYSFPSPKKHLFQEEAKSFTLAQHSYKDSGTTPNKDLSAQIQSIYTSQPHKRHPTPFQDHDKTPIEKAYGYHVRQSVKTQEKLFLDLVEMGFTGNKIKKVLTCTKAQTVEETLPYLIPDEKGIWHHKLVSVAMVKQNLDQTQCSPRKDFEKGGSMIQCPQKGYTGRMESEVKNEVVPSVNFEAEFRTVEEPDQPAMKKNGRCASVKKVILTQNSIILNNTKFMDLQSKTLPAKDHVQQATATPLQTDMFYQRVFGSGADIATSGGLVRQSGLMEVEDKKFNTVEAGEDEGLCIQKMIDEDLADGLDCLNEDGKGADMLNSCKPLPFSSLNLSSKRKQPKTQRLTSKIEPAIMNLAHLTRKSTIEKQRGAKHNPGHPKLKQNKEQKSISSPQQLKASPIFQIINEEQKESPQHTDSERYQSVGRLNLQPMQGSQGGQGAEEGGVPPMHISDPQSRVLQFSNPQSRRTQKLNLRKAKTSNKKSFSTLQGDRNRIAPDFYVPVIDSKNEAYPGIRNNSFSRHNPHYNYNWPSLEDSMTRRSLINLQKNQEVSVISKQKSGGGPKTPSGAGVDEYLSCQGTNQDNEVCQVCGDYLEQHHEDFNIDLLQVFFQFDDLNQPDDGLPQEVVVQNERKEKQREIELRVAKMLEGHGIEMKKKCVKTKKNRGLTSLIKKESTTRNPNINSQSMRSQVSHIEGQVSFDHARQALMESRIMMRKHGQTPKSMGPKEGLSMLSKRASSIRNNNNNIHSLKLAGSPTHILSTQNKSIKNIKMRKNKGHIRLQSINQTVSQITKMSRTFKFLENSFNTTQHGLMKGDMPNMVKPKEINAPMTSKSGVTLMGSQCLLCEANIDMINNKMGTNKCEHYYCYQCMLRYIESKIKMNQVFDIECPHCVVESRNMVMTLSDQIVEACLFRKENMVDAETGQSRDLGEEDLEKILHSARATPTKLEVKLHTMTNKDLSGKSDVFRQYFQLRQNIRLMTDRTIIFCPTPTCSKAISTEPQTPLQQHNGQLSSSQITCDSCQTTFCKICLYQHSPSHTCQQEIFQRYANSKANYSLKLQNNPHMLNPFSEEFCKDFQDRQRQNIEHRIKDQDIIPSTLQMSCPVRVFLMILCFILAPFAAVFVTPMIGGMIFVREKWRLGSETGARCIVTSLRNIGVLLMSVVVVGLLLIGFPIITILLWICALEYLCK